MRRRGLFGWFAGLIAAPAAAGGIGGTGRVEYAFGSARVLKPIRGVKITDLPSGGVITNDIFASAADARSRSVKIGELVRRTHADVEAMGARREERERVAEASVCRAPREFTAFMTERLGDQGMIP